MINVKTGDRVAIFQLGGFLDREDVVIRMTAKQGELKSGEKFWLKDGRIFNSCSEVCEVTPAIEQKLAKRREDALQTSELRSLKRRMSSAHNEMLSGNYAGFTIEDLEPIALAMEAAIESKKARVGGSDE